MNSTRIPPVPTLPRKAPPVLTKPPRPRRFVPGRPERSIADAAQLDSVPPELKERRQWVCWKYELRERRWTKVPYQRDHQPADSTDPATWGGFDALLQAYLNGPDFDGIGFVFSADDPFAGIDLDRCLQADGTMKPWASDLYALLQGGYAEVSPSGLGIKVWVRGKVPGDRHKKTGFGEDRNGAVELYDSKRFFTVTGKMFSPAINGGKL